MSYRILEFRMGTDTAQAYVLQGQGDDEGTNATISVATMNALLYRVPGEADAASQFLAEALDRIFERAHAERLAAQFNRVHPPETAETTPTPSHQLPQGQDT